MKDGPPMPGMPPLPAAGYVLARLSGNLPRQIRDPLDVQLSKEIVLDRQLIATGLELIDLSFPNECP